MCISSRPHIVTHRCLHAPSPHNATYCMVISFSLPPAQFGQPTPTPHARESLTTAPPMLCLSLFLLCPLPPSGFLGEEASLQSHCPEPQISSRHSEQGRKGTTAQGGGVRGGGKRQGDIEGTAPPRAWGGNSGCRQVVPKHFVSAPPGGCWSPTGSGLEE